MGTNRFCAACLVTPMHLPISVHDAPDRAGLVDEVADEMVGDLAEGLGGEHGVGELFERFVCTVLDDVDEVVKADGVGDLGRLGHGVNSRLTLSDRQPSG